MRGLWGPKEFMESKEKKSGLDSDFAAIFFKPIAKYLTNPDTSEIMVNAHDDIWVEDNLGLRKIPESFTPDELASAVNSLAQYIGRPIIENVFSIDARMPDGSRVCIVLPPVSGSDPIFAIRKFKEAITDLNFLVDKKSLSAEMAELIRVSVGIKKNMLVAGGTSSGKTTLLNLIAGTIPDEDRIITIEDSKELQLKQDHILALEARPADKHGKGAFSIRDCLKSTLRLRPDRIVVGEIRGGEAFDLIQAMNTGHGGCMGTVHANTPTDTLRRMESLCLMAGIDMPIVAVRAMVASAINMIVTPARLSDGSRRIIHIAEVGPLTENGDYQTFDIARFEAKRRDPETGKILGAHVFTGHVPGFFGMFAAEGLDVPIEFFRKRVSGEIKEEIIEDFLKDGYEVNGEKDHSNHSVVVPEPLTQVNELEGEEEEEILPEPEETLEEEVVYQEEEPEESLEIEEETEPLSANEQVALEENLSQFAFEQNEQNDQPENQETEVVSEEQFDFQEQEEEQPILRSNSRRKQPVQESFENITTEEAEEIEGAEQTAEELFSFEEEVNPEENQVTFEEQPEIAQEPKQKQQQPPASDLAQRIKQNLGEKKNPNNSPRQKQAKQPPPKNPNQRPPNQRAKSNDPEKPSVSIPDILKNLRKKNFGS